MIDKTDRDRVRDNWLRVQEEVRSAATQCGRDPDSVLIVGVSKYVGPELTEALVDAGCGALGESRPQQLWQKSESLQFDEQVSWHLIGHLQRNKIRRTLHCDPVIHSVDSIRLLKAIAEESDQQKRVTNVLLEVNVSGEDAKTGFAVEALDEAIGLLPLAGVRVAGLMAMAGWGTGADDARRQFARSRQLRDKLMSPELPLDALSMGMSGDFKEAIAEGATMVRVGSRLFEGVERE